MFVCAFRRSSSVLSAIWLGSVAALRHGDGVRCRLSVRCITAFILVPFAVACGDDASGGGAESSAAQSGTAGSTSGAASSDSDTAGTADTTGSDPSTGMPADEGTTEGGGTTEAATSETTGDDSAGAVCEAGSVCVGEIPRGWEGPVSLQEIELGAVPTCGGLFPQLQVDAGLSGLTADPFECTCDCEAGDVACEGSARVRISSPAPSGAGFPCAAPIPPGGAPIYDDVLNVTVSSGLTQAYAVDELAWESCDVHGRTIDDVELDLVGGCEPVATETPAPLEWSTRTIACGTFDVGGGCEMGEVCVPQPLSPTTQDVCIWSEGDIECPDSYPERSVVYGGEQDTRACSDCSCGAADASCSDPVIEVRWWSVTDILGATTTYDAPSNVCQTTMMANVCGFYPGGPGEIDFVSELEFDGKVPCPPAGGEPVGEAVGVDPITFCCAGL